MPKSENYIYLRAWNSILASPEGWNLDKAKDEKAPADAIYRKHEGGWATYDEITSPTTKFALDMKIQEIRLRDRYIEKINPSLPIPSSAATRVAQFITKREAIAAARRIGWSTTDATRVSIMGFLVWVVCDPHGCAVTRDGMVALSREG